MKVRQDWRDKEVEMRSLLLLLILTLVVPSYSQAYFIRDKELAEVLARMTRNAEEKALNNYLESRPKARISGDVHLSEAEVVVPKYKDNPNGFVPGTDRVEFFALKDDAKTYSTDISGYFLIKLERGETCQTTSTLPAHFALWIKDNPEQYFIQITYTAKDNSVTRSFSEVAKSISYIRAPAPGGMLTIRVTRMPAFHK